MQILGKPTDVLTPERIVSEYNSALKEVISAGQDPTQETERQMLIRLAREAILMTRGQHFNVPGVVDTQWGQIMDYVPFDPSMGSEPTGAEIRLCPPVNFIGGDAYTFMAVMGQSSPRVKAIADNPRDPDQIEKARNADANLRDIWAKQKIDRQWVQVAFHQYATGPVFLRGIWKVDRLKYGASTEPKLEVGPDGELVQIGLQEYENGDAEMVVNSILEVGILPYTATNLDEVDVLKCETMRSKWDLIRAFPQLEEFRDSEPTDREASASSGTAAETREAAVNPSGTGRIKRPNQWRYSEFWLKPYLLEAVKDEKSRNVLKTYFPDGLYVAKVADTIVKAENRNVKDEWAVVKVGRGGPIMQRPLCADGVPLQKTLNDIAGLAVEATLREIPITLIDGQLIDREAWSKKDAIPHEIVPVPPSVEGDLSKKIAEIKPARLGDQVIPLGDKLRLWWENITGISERLFGGGEAAPTFRQEKMRRDAALAKLAPQAAEQRFGAEDIGRILVKLRAKYGVGTVTSTQKGAFGIKTDIVEQAELSESGWHVESNDKFPMTNADTFDTLWGLIKEMPEAADILGLLGPLNVEQVLETFQVPDFASAMEAQKHKTLDVVQQLLQQQPIEGPQGTQPSVPMDEFDNAQFVALLLGVWMVSEGPRERGANPAGFENVLLYWKQYQQAAQPKQAQEPPVRGNMNFSAKLEDFPQLVPAVMAAAGADPNQIPQDTAPIPPPQPEPTQMAGQPTEEENPDALPELPPMEAEQPTVQ